MKGKFGNMEPISFKQHDIKCVNLCNFETKKLWDSETKKPATTKPRNQATKKSRKQETKKPINQETKKLIDGETKKRRSQTPRNQETKKLITLPLNIPPPNLEPICSQLIWIRSEGSVKVFRKCRVAVRIKLGWVVAWFNYGQGSAKQPPTMRFAISTYR